MADDRPHRQLQRLLQSDVANGRDAQSGRLRRAQDLADDYGFGRALVRDVAAHVATTGSRLDNHVHAVSLETPDG